MFSKFSLKKLNVLKSKQVNSEKSSKKFGWVSFIIHKTRSKRQSQASNTAPNEVNQSEKIQYNIEDNVIYSCIHSSLVAKPYPLLRYNKNTKDQLQSFFHRLLQPFTPIYEIEWKKDQWLQLEKSNNKLIERVRKNGFSKVFIRKDAGLMKHILYNDPTQLNILLEITFSTDNQDLFSVRRTHWWRMSYEIGQANLPDWLDKNTCCASFTTLATNVPTKSIKPLHYTDPPFLLDS